jgi:integrase
MVHHISANSLPTYLSGICSGLEHIFPDIRDVRKHPIVIRTLKGCKKMHGKPIRRKRSIGRHEIAPIIQKYSMRSSFDDLLWLVMFLTAFRALLRLGELVSPDNPKLSSSRKRIMRSTVVISQDSFSFTLPYHKADRFYTGSKVLVCSRPNSTDDVFPWFQKYVIRRDKMFPFVPDLWLRGDGSSPTRSWFLNRLSEFFDKSVSGHSLRAGGATAMAEDGCPPLVIQLAGRWASDSFTTYIRKHPEILAAQLSHNL